MKKMIYTGLVSMMLSSLCFAAEPENVIGTLSFNDADQSCPVIVNENGVTYCGKFGFVSLDLQKDMVELLSKYGTVRMVGENGKRETGEGTPANIFIISYIDSGNQ